MGDGSVAPGSYADVYLLGNIESDVISVPTKSVIEEQGKYAVCQREQGAFEKRPVAIAEQTASVLK